MEEVGEFVDEHKQCQKWHVGLEGHVKKLVPTYSNQEMHRIQEVLLVQWTKK